MIRRSDMKKKISAMLLALCLLCGLVLPCACAAGEDGALRTIQALGILNGDSSGNLNLDSSVTRAEFAKMLSAASRYKDTLSGEGTGYSLFKDVKSSHWASEYIRLAIQEGWMIGYTDGTFRPDRTVTLEEACTTLLRVLGYDTSSLAGSFPSAQLNKAAALGLRDQLGRRQGETLTRRDCVTLFYNLLTAQTSGGQVYAVTLGYTVTDGRVDDSAIALENLQGPYVADGASALPFQPVTIYRDGKVSASSVLDQYDVYYYNTGLSTLWIYTDRVSGKLTALSPSTTAPTSVTVAGNTYPLGSSTAAYKLSVLGGGAVGDVVTLLLGMDGKVVDVLTGAAVDATYYGVVLSSEKILDGEETAAIRVRVDVVCTDGVTRTFTVEGSTAYSSGRLVCVQVTGDGVSVQSLSDKTTSGKVNSTATKLGTLAFAEDVEILDTSSTADTAVIDVQRLAGCTLSSSDVRYYTLDANGQIDRLILNDVTGDTWTYGYMTSASSTEGNMSISSSYTYLVNGVTSTLRSSTSSYSVETGGMAIRYESGGAVKSIRNLGRVRLTSLGASTAMADSQQYGLSDDVQVYLIQSGSCYLTSLRAVNTEEYTLTGWYDNFGCAAGGQIRVITAAAK